VSSITLFVLHRAVPPPALLSFPTRRSSDLKITRPAHFKVSFAQFESLRCRRHYFHAQLGIIRLRLAGEQAAALFVTPPHTASQLMQRRQTKAFGIEDDHHRRIRHVDADFDDSR